MLRIGEFSRLGRVSVKALRYYDEMGLLRPASVDRFTGYRYYTAEQLHQLARILALKDLGLSLEQIAQLQRQGLPVEELRGMLRLKQAEIQQQLDEEQARLDRIVARLKQIEQEGIMPAYEVIVKDVPAIRVASVRGVVADYGDQARLWDEVVSYLDRHNLTSTSPCFTVYYDDEYREHEVDLEVCQPVEASLGSEGRVVVRDLPAVPHMASLVHRGPYAGLNTAYQALMGWITSNGYRIAGPNREVYVRNRADHGVEPADLLTEIQFPVTKTATDA